MGIVEDKPIMLDYWTASCDKDVLIGVRENGEKLVASVNQFAEMFWAAKDVKTKRVTCPYPPSLEVVHPDL